MVCTNQLYQIRSSFLRGFTCLIGGEGLFGDEGYATINELQEAFDAFAELDIKHPLALLAGLSYLIGDDYDWDEDNWEGLMEEFDVDHPALLLSALDSIFAE